VKLTTHLHLVPRSKNKWSYTSTPQYVFMKAFTFTFYPYSRGSVADMLLSGCRQNRAASLWVVLAAMVMGITLGLSL
jgi:hypothetical protein